MNMTGTKKWLLAIVLVSALPAAARAQGPMWGPWNGWVDGYGQGHVVTYNDNMPYFSAHPPVYYSLDVLRRPMGPSPFAYPGYYAPAPVQVEVMAPMPTKSQATMVNNSYFAEKHSGDQKPVRNASYAQPLDREAAAGGAQMILNPFVKR